MKKSIVAMSLLAGLGAMHSAQAVDVKFNFRFTDADASVQGFFIVDDSALSNVYNGGTVPADGGLIDFSKVKDLSLDYMAGEFASGGGHYTLADYSSLTWTSDMPVNFHSDDIAWDWASSLGAGLDCTTAVGHVAFSFGRAGGSSAPTSVGPTCMAGTSPDVYRQPSLYSLYMDTSYVPTPVPEPGTYALMLAGLGVVGWSARRRRG
ncbi:PEP-CTERM sorting domain-containing protein [Piscinibacter terrae]|uniref:PEP-CTERM sorting domain-containing protein n=1 Tax=Piscinibacter terrae TaxID=2496871 RepID=A0A3N7HMP9_9BURK|nr:PEP-CTERM sorting domain-containing protein [Albitalea terrae]RQP22883.1 PEP-CTERM sorting domain-containing protein [Albitalea terrae]